MIACDKARSPHLYAGDQSSTEGHLSALSNLGLSQYESKCFLASLQTGPATINQIGIVAGVPRTKVYGAIRKLVERGLLEESEHDSKIFVARSPKDTLIPLLEKEEKRIKSNLESLAELDVIHQSMAYVKKAEAQRSKILRYHPRSSVTRKMRELFETCRRSVVALTTANGLIRLSKLSDVLFERSREGLRLEVISPVLDEPVFTTAVQSLKEIEGASVSIIRSLVSIQIVVVDSQSLLFSEPKPDDIREEGMDVGFLIQNSELSEMVEGLIRMMSPLRQTETRLAQ